MENLGNLLHAWYNCSVTVPMTCISGNQAPQTLRQNEHLFLLKHTSDELDPNVCSVVKLRVIYDKQISQVSV